MPPVALTLGPLFFHWPAERLGDFYRRIADEAPVERVHLGEVVCGKRMPFSDPVWPELIERLERAGKEVVLSTLAAPITARERRSTEGLCGDDRLVEIDDVTALPARTGKPFVAGPFVNIYNGTAAQFLVRRGARTICPPVELSLAHVAAIARTCPEAEFEMFAFGRLPLALSGRCYHARLHGLHKDSCQFTCEKDPDGLVVDTLDDQSFLAINGVQTMSAQVQAAMPTPAECAASGISRLRLSPRIPATWSRWRGSTGPSQRNDWNRNMLAARIGQPYRLELNLMALSMWLWGGMLYIWMMSLIFYRYAFFRFSPADLAPPYWINMGAMAISTLAGSHLILNAPHAPYLMSLLPFLKGFTVFYWATGTWWIPMLLLLGIWRYVFKRFPFEYDPLYWGAVFPLGMYSACTWQMDRAMEFGFLSVLPQAFLYVALAAWAVTFLGMLRALLRTVLGK